MTRPTYFYECGGCDHNHPLGWTGDCRDNDHRYRDDQLPAGARIMDEHAPIPPAGVVPNEGVEVGCGNWACRDCYEVIQ